MNIIGAPLIQGTLLTGSAATYYTSTNCRTRVDKLTLCNDVGGAARLVTIYKIASGGSASSANTVTYQKTVLSGQTVDVFEMEGHWLAPGDFIQVLCDAASDVSIAASGIQTPQ